MEPEISTKILRNLREKLGAKLPAATRSFFMVKFARLDDDFSEFFGTGSKPNRRSIPEAKRLGKEKRKGGKEIKNEKKKKEKNSRKKKKTFRRNFDFCACPSENVVKSGVCGKKRMVPCCKCNF